MNTHIPDLSVIILCFNSEKYIKKCLDKILSVDLNIEIIVVNDGSTDRSLALLKKYKNKIKLINLEKNSGVCNARNVGLKTSSSRYVTFIDIDDDFDISGYVDAIRFIKSEKLDLLVFNLDFIEKNKCAIKTRNSGLSSNSSKKDIIRSFLLDRLYPSASVLIVSQEIAKKVQFDLRLCPGEDIHYMLRCLIRSQSPKYFNKVIYHYVQNEDSILHNLSSNFVTNMLSVVSYLNENERKYLSDNFEQEFNYFKLQMVYRAVHAVSLVANKNNKKDAIALINECNFDKSFRKIYRHNFSSKYLKIEFFVLSLFGPHVHLMLFPFYIYLRKIFRRFHK